MAGRQPITTTQATAVLVSTAIGVGVLSLPYLVASEAGGAAPLATVLGVGFAVGALALNIAVGLRFPAMSIIRYSEALLGLWLGKAAGALIALLFGFLTALAAREFGEIVMTTLLHRTPIEVVLTLTLLMAAVSARHDLTTFAYIHLFYLPFILIPIWIIMVVALRFGDPLQVMPVWTGDWLGVAKGALSASSLFQGAFVITVLIPFLQRPRLAWRVIGMGMAIVGALMTTAVVATLTVLGTEETKQFFWPTLELIRSITLPGEVLERIDVMVAIVWVVAVYTTLFSSYYLSVYACGEIVHLRDHRPFALALLPFMVAVALLPQDVHQLYRVIDGTGYVIDAVSVAYPLLLLVLARLRGKGGEVSDERSDSEPSSPPS
ncbi:MAG: endospore germination permease [Kyrpidia sp.]|nr:endospore germination permease [Kyrpidia sp.]